MERKTRTREKYERNITESGLSRNSKVGKRKSKASLCEWQTTDDQSNKKGIEEYKCINPSRYCSEIVIVVPTGEDEYVTVDTFAKFDPERVVINKSEYDIIKPDSGICSRNSVGQYLNEIQCKTGTGEKDNKSMRTMDSRKNGRAESLQKRHVFRQTFRECSVPAVKNLEPDAIIPREKSFVFQTLPNKPKLKPHSGGKHIRRLKNCHLNENDQSLVESSESNLDSQVTCSSHVYTFNKGLVPSRDAHSLELFRTQHFLPPVVTERIGNISEQKHYRLPREKHEKSSSNVNHFLNAFYSNDQGLDQKTESKLVVYKEFPAETVIPASYGRNRYFDFQGYIDFLCKERDLRKTSARNTRQLGDWNKLETNSWLDNIGDTLVKEVFNYSRLLDIKGSRMKLDENPQMKFQARPLCEQPFQQRFLGNTIYFKPQKTLKVTPIMKRKKPKEKAVLIERLPSKFHFTLPGRPPSSDDSGFAE